VIGGSCKASCLVAWVAYSGVSSRGWRPQTGHGLIASDIYTFIKNDRVAIQSRELGTNCARFVLGLVLLSGSA